MRYVSCVTIALAMTFSCASAHADNGSILFTHSLAGTCNGASAQLGSGFFLINDNGTDFRQPLR